MARILTLFICCCTTLLISQVTIVAEQDTVFKSGLSADFQISGRISITNNGPTSTFTWVRDDSGFVNGWESAVYDPQQCYSRSVDTQSFELIGGGSGELTIHLYPNGACGVGQGVLVLTDNNNAENTITLRYDFEALTDDGTECSTTSVSEFRLNYIKVYPNPANDFFTLTDVPADLELIQVFNILGGKVKTFTASQSANYDISNLNTGLYLVNLTNSKGENLNTVKLHKN